MNPRSALCVALLSAIWLFEVQYSDKKVFQMFTIEKQEDSIVKNRKCNGANREEY